MVTDLDRVALERLERDADPLVRLQLALRVGAPVPGGLLEEAATHPAVEAAARSQAADGGWAAGSGRRARVLATLRAVSVLAELGVTGTRSWSAAVAFLAREGLAPDGAVSLTGDRDGVLSCYVGTAARALALGGRRDLAAAQVAWLVRHQEVRRAGVERRTDPVVLYAPALRTRYGGCMAATTCVLGLTKVGSALTVWCRTEQDPPAERLLAAVRDALLARSLFVGRTGPLPALGSPPCEPDRWLRPGFPLDWRTDLAEMLEVAAGSSPADPRAARAVAVLRDQQLPDGGWRLGWSVPPDPLGSLGRRRRGSSSPWATLRVLGALGVVGAR